MQHTPYGYDIIGGKAVVNEEQASNIHKICDNYLGGMSFISAAADVGLTMSHCGVKRMIQNKKLLGDSFYPAILTEETARQIEEERIRREKALGRDQRGHKKVEKAKLHIAFSMPRVPRKYDNPIRQAEFAYRVLKKSSGIDCPARTIHEEVLQTAVVTAVNDAWSRKDAILPELRENIRSVLQEDTDAKLAEIDAEVKQKQTELLGAGKDQSRIDEIGDAIMTLREKRQTILTEAAM